MKSMKFNFEYNSNHISDLTEPWLSLREINNDIESAMLFNGRKGMENIPSKNWNACNKLLLTATDDCTQNMVDDNYKFYMWDPFSTKMRRLLFTYYEYIPEHWIWLMAMPYASMCLSNIHLAISSISPCTSRYSHDKFKIVTFTHPAIHSHPEHFQFHFQLMCPVLHPIYCIVSNDGIRKNPFHLTVGAYRIPSGAHV